MHWTALRKQARSVYEYLSLAMYMSSLASSASVAKSSYLTNLAAARAAAASRLDLSTASRRAASSAAAAISCVVFVGFRRIGVSPLGRDGDADASLEAD